MTHILHQIKEGQFRVEHLLTVPLQHLVGTHLLQLMVLDKGSDGWVVDVDEVKVLS